MGTRHVRHLAGTVAAASMVSLIFGCREDLPEKAKASTAETAVVAPPRDPAGARKDLTAKRVLLIHSYHPEYPWVDTITQGVRSAIEPTGANLRVVYMDTKRHPDLAWKAEAGQKAKTVAEEYKPDVILTVDDDAQTYCGKGFVGGTIPVVFTGVDADPSKYGYPASNVTGVIERPHFRESLALAGRLRPIRKIAVMSCSDSTSVAAIGFMKQEELPVAVEEWRMVNDLDQWKQAVLHFNTRVDALVIRSYQAVPKPGGREVEDPKVVADWTVRNAAIPTIAFHDFEINDGLLVGVVKSGNEYGGMAADYAVQIMRGASPESLPIRRTRTGIPMVNRATAARLGIALADDAVRGVTVVAGN